MTLKIKDSYICKTKGLFIILIFYLSKDKNNKYIIRFSSFFVERFFFFLVWRVIEKSQQTCCSLLSHTYVVRAPKCKCGACTCNYARTLSWEISFYIVCEWKTNDSDETLAFASCHSNKIELAIYCRKQH